MLPLRHKAIVLAAAAALGLVLAVPSFVWGPRAGYPIEYGYLLIAVMACARTRAQRPARVAFVALYALSLLFLVYAHLFPTFFHQEAALVEDYKLAINLYHFLSEMKT